MCQSLNWMMIFAEQTFQSASHAALAVAQVAEVIARAPKPEIASIAGQALKVLLCAISVEHSVSPMMVCSAKCAGGRCHQNQHLPRLQPQHRHLRLCRHQHLVLKTAQVVPSLHASDCAPPIQQRTSMHVCR